jgi:3-dehydroquinate dehydratase/shikimate dehydrogenase
MPTVESLTLDYAFPELSTLDSLYGIVMSRPTRTSLFLRRLNAAYRRSAMASLFLPFVVPDLEAFHRHFWIPIGRGLDDVGLPVRGLTMAAPFKEAALDLATTVSATARQSGAANLVVRGDNWWRATTTDGAAAVSALRQVTTLPGRRVAVIGCGGAGRAAAAALRDSGADVSLVNRGAVRRDVAASVIGLPAVPLDEFVPSAYEVIVHATSACDDIAFDVGQVADDAVVLDFVCAAQPTALVTAARDRGLSTVDGRQVIAHEVAQQFHEMTGRDLPVGLEADP